MKKMSVLYETVNHRVIDKVREENLWVFNEPSQVTVTRKYDGQATAVIRGVLYRRYDAKHGKVAPEGAIPCCDPDPITGHWPHWLKVDEHIPNDKYLWAAWLEQRPIMFDGTYEFCGPTVGGNKERLLTHLFIRHGLETYNIQPLTDFNISVLLNRLDVEGFVFYHKDGRMCKLRKGDYGVKRL